MNMWTSELIKSQLRAMSEAPTDAEAWKLYLDPSTCCVRAYELIREAREDGMTVSEAAKKAVGGL